MIKRIGCVVGAVLGYVVGLAYAIIFRGEDE